MTFEHVASPTGQFNCWPQDGCAFFEELLRHEYGMYGKHLATVVGALDRVLCNGELCCGDILAIRGVCRSFQRLGDQVGSLVIEADASEKVVSGVAKIWGSKLTHIDASAVPLSFPSYALVLECISRECSASLCVTVSRAVLKQPPSQTMVHCAVDSNTGTAWCRLLKASFEEANMPAFLCEAVPQLVEATLCLHHRMVASTEILGRIFARLALGFTGKGFLAQTLWVSTTGKPEELWLWWAHECLHVYAGCSDQYISATLSELQHVELCASSLKDIQFTSPCVEGSIQLRSGYAQCEAAEWRRQVIELAEDFCMCTALPSHSIQLLQREHAVAGAATRTELARLCCSLREAMCMANCACGPSGLLVSCEAAVQCDVTRLAVYASMEMSARSFFLPAIEDLVHLVEIIERQHQTQRIRQGTDMGVMVVLQSADSLEDLLPKLPQLPGLLLVVCDRPTALQRIQHLWASPQPVHHCTGVAELTEDLLPVVWESLPEELAGTAQMLCTVALRYFVSKGLPLQFASVQQAIRLAKALKGLLNNATSDGSVAGDVALRQILGAAAAIFMGVLSLRERQELLSLWCYAELGHGDMGLFELLHQSTPSPGIPRTQQGGGMESVIVQDMVSEQNRCLLHSSRMNWVIVVGDPERMLGWGATVAQSKGTQLRVLDMGQPRIIREIETAIQFGHDVMMTLAATAEAPLDCPWWLWDLCETKQCRMGGVQVLKFGDSTIDLSPDFRLFLVVPCVSQFAALPLHVPQNFLVLNFTAVQQSVTAYYSGSDTYSWLSAFNIAEPFFFDGLEYPSVENCYHAQKIDPKNPNAQTWKKKFTEKELSGLQAKQKAGPGKLKFKTEKSDPRTMYFIRNDWDDVKVEIMKDITKEYYLANPKLMKQLIDIGDTVLVHTGPRIDTYWGVDAEGNGVNMHGHILMELREKT